MITKKTKNSVLYLSTYPPRECGIATFTRDLATAFDKLFNPDVKSRVLAVNDTSTSFYNYPSKVWSSINAGNLENYVEMAERINRNKKIKLVNIQHEFGIFGGDWGDYLIPMLQAIKKPVVITFHSVLADPDDHLKKIVQLIAQNSQAIVVLNDRSRDVLKLDYQIPKYKVVVIPHGIPGATFEPSKNLKKQLNLERKIVLSTFGMLSRDKGVEYAIRALPRVVKKFPNVIYLVIGATHPQVRRHEGESYRNFLIKEVDRLGLKQHVKFYNKYLPLDEIVNHLKATDIYICSAINPKQSVSGTLAYALGCGRAVVSTPTEYAKYVVSPEKNGLFVKFKNAASISHALLRILEDEKWLKSMHHEAYESTRHMTWPNVAASYFKLYNRFADLETEEKKLPEIKLDHLIRLTDDFGIIHHARYSKPEKRFGYSFDDNARALMVSAEYYEKNPEPEVLELIKTYLKFFKFTRRPSGNFVAIINSKRQKDPAPGSEDIQGRALWALGYIVSKKSLPQEIKKEAKKLLAKTIPTIRNIKSPRSMAFAMLGIYYYLQECSSKRLENELKKLAGRQIRLFKENTAPDWQWFEEVLTYSNSKMPESLFRAYEVLGDEKYLDVAEKSLKFLSRVTFEPEHYTPIGQNGWYLRHKKRAYFDQQPEDAASMVQTKIAAYKITNNKEYLDDAFKAFQWFLGKNHLGRMVYDEVTGGCHDGVGEHAVNLNQGAESTLSYLMARFSFEEPGIKESFEV